MKRSAPKVSVLMSVYNGSQYLAESIESILEQTFGNFEFVIINDCSTDNTEAILARYAEQDERIKLFTNDKNLGLTKSLNKGLNLAKGEYIARQDADDVSLPKRLEKQVALLDKEPEVVLVSCDIEVIDAEGYFVKYEKRSCPRFWVAWYLMFYNHIGGHSQVVFRRKSAIELGGYCENYRYAQDYEFWCRLIKVGEIVILPEVLHQLRRHGKGITSEKRPEQLNYALNISRNNLKKLLNQELTLEEVFYLRKFWSGHVLGGFPEIQGVSFINNIQLELFEAFFKQTGVRYPLKPELSNQIHLMIGKQFICWLWSLSIIKYLPLRLKISSYAFNWYPMGVIIFWLKEVYVRPLLLIKPQVTAIKKKLVKTSNF